MLNNIASMLGAGGATIGDYESIATVSVGAGGTATVSFTSIPSTYTHLQIRSINLTATSLNTINMTFNGSSASYAQHVLYGDGATAAAAAVTSTTNAVIGLNGTTTAPSAIIVDILDYTSTNKNKTVRSLSGFDANGSGYVQLRSSLWYATPAAISSIGITVAGGANFAQYSSFALYGIK